ncbi:hypothetical protein GCM10018793_19380 [Streptomyces sulfonofaciens]|uniref:Uncharacterized protein n=1 Tax=Streptomyces sulfonofaciens TaxID=68272 RepID=A0A919G195_9ACTN|nr:hypothetical protein GCM10018793_19380 [Streptomyces sulfonofaciens]
MQVHAVESGDLSAACTVDLGETCGGDHVESVIVGCRGARSAPGTGMQGGYEQGAQAAPASGRPPRSRNGHTGRRTPRGPKEPGAGCAGAVPLRARALERCGGPQRAHVQHRQRAPGVVITSVAGWRLLVAVMATVKQTLRWRGRATGHPAGARVADAAGAARAGSCGRGRAREPPGPRTKVAACLMP